MSKDDALLPIYKTVLDLLDRYGTGMTEVEQLTATVRDALGIEKPKPKFSAPESNQESNDA